MYADNVPQLVTHQNVDNSKPETVMPQHGVAHSYQKL